METIPTHLSNEDIFNVYPNLPKSFSTLILADYHKIRSFRYVLDRNFLLFYVLYTIYNKKYYTLEDLLGGSFMQCIEKLVREIYEHSNVPFQLSIQGAEEYSTPQFNIFENCITKEVKFKGINYVIKVSTKFSVAIQLLELYINEKLKNIFMKKEEIILGLLQAKDMDKNIIKNVWPEVIEEFNIINIYIEDNHNKIMKYIIKSYLNTDACVVNYGKYITVVGKMQDCIQHAKSITEVINNEFSQKCYIAFRRVENYSMLKNEFNKTTNKIDLAIKYGIKQSIFDENSLILEEIIDSISDEKKEKFFNSFSNNLLKLDEEMIRTIEVFFKCGLNLSEASQQLYIHRNTLIYRLDKIEKHTSYNIREFNNAMLFKIAFFYLGRKKNLMVENI